MFLGLIGLSLEDPVSLVTNIGFPITAFLLIYMDLRKKLDTLIKDVNKLVNKNA